VACEPPSRLGDDQVYLDLLDAGAVVLFHPRLWLDDPPLIYLFVWLAAAGGGSLGGMTRDDIVSYYLVLIVVNQITYSQSNWTVGDLIRAGGMNALLLRPVPPILHTLADEVAGKVVYLTLIVPLTALLGLLLHPRVPWTWESAATFLPALVLAWLLRFVWGYSLALLAFWATRADALLAVQDTLVFLLARQVAPLALLPTPMQAAARALPFRYMLGFPVEVLNGQLSAGEIIQGFAVGGAWRARAAGGAALLWRQGLRRYAAVGG
jgi:ABC-2 type transport system permease protein